MIEYRYTFHLNIGPGKYTLTSAVHKDDTHVNESYHWCDNILNFEVAGSKDYMFTSLSMLDVTLDINTI
jgi:lipopolysaccharide transport system ATP-binding protein